MKVTIHFLPAPTFVLLCQLTISALVVKVCDMRGYLEADKFEWDKVGEGHMGRSDRPPPTHTYTSQRVPT